MSIFQSIADSIALKATDVADKKIDGIAHGQAIVNVLENKMSKKLSHGVKLKLLDYLLEVSNGMFLDNPRELADLLVAESFRIIDAQK